MRSELTYAIIEDSPKVCNGIKERMDEHPQWKCCCFLHHKIEAIKEIKIHKPQLLFIDWALKGGSAYEVLAEILSVHGYTPYIIFNTGYQSENPEIPQEIINKYNVDKYLVKPIWENLRLYLSEYLIEAEHKYNYPKKWQNDYWLMDVTRKLHRINVNNIVCVLQYFDNPYNKIFISDNETRIIVKMSWNSVQSLLLENSIDYFITNNREHIVAKKYIQSYKRPYLRLMHMKQTVEVVKNKLCAFEKWLTL